LHNRLSLAGARSDDAQRSPWARSRSLRFDQSRWLRLGSQCFFLGPRAGAGAALAANPGGSAETRVFSVFGLRASRLPRFRSLAIKSPFAHARSARSTKIRRRTTPGRRGATRQCAPHWTMSRQISNPPVRSRSAYFSKVKCRRARFVRGRGKTFRAQPSHFALFFGDEL
jgi:hypothetical protein